MKNLVIGQLKQSFRKNSFYRLDCILGVELRGSKSDADLFVKKIRACFSRINSCENIEKVKFHAMKNGIWSVPLSNTLPKIVSVDLTLLKLMVPGSVWKDGELVWSPEAKYSLELDTFTAEETFLSLESPQFHAQKNNDIKLIKSRSALVNGVSSIVLVPTMEIIRYFFASSNSLVSHLFNTPEFVESLIHEFNVDQINKMTRLKMAKSLKKSDAKVMAWAVSDDNAKKAMNLINSSVVQELVLNPERNLVYPLTNFPFKGDASIQVDGHFLNVSDGRCVFLVTRIKDCDYQHPIQLIELEGIEPFSYRAKSNVLNKHKVDIAEQRVSTEKVQLSLNLISHERPGQRKLRKNISSFGDLYSGIKGVEVKLCNEECVNMPDINRLKDYVRKQVGSKIESIQCSTLPETYGAENNIRALNLRDGYGASERGFNDREGKMDLVLSVIDALRDSLPEFRVEFVSNNGVSDRLEFYEFDMNNSGSSWGTIEGRPRKAIFAKLMFRGFSVSLLEIERKKHEKFALYFLANEIRENHFDAQDFLSKISRAAGKNLSRQIFKSHFQIYDRVYHSPVDYQDSFKWRIFSKIDEFLQLRVA